MKKILLLLLFFFFVKSYPISETKSDSIKIRNQILILKQKNDSLAKRLDQIEKNDYKSVEVIEKVNDFYDRSWNKLMYFLGVSGSIALLLVPYAQAKNQEKKYNLKIKELEELTNGKVNELESKIIDFHHEQFELLRKEIVLSQQELNNNIEKESEYLNAHLFVLRGLIGKINNKYDEYFKHYIIALNKFISLNKEPEIEKMITAITEAIVKCITNETKIKKENKFRLEKLISILEKDHYEIFPDIIDNLKTQSLKLTTK